MIRTDRRKLLWLICLLLIPFVVGGIVYGFFSMDLFGGASPDRDATRKKYAMLAFFVALAVVLTVIVAGWIRARRREGGLEAGLSVGTGGRGEIDALRKSWKESVAKLKETAVSGGGTRALAALPWYVIIGPPGGGKSTLLRGSGIDFPVGDAAIRGLQGTRNCDWWFSNVGIFLDTAGRYISDESAQEWGQFLDLVRKHRIRSPINGVIVAIPAKTLIEGSDGEQDLDARRIRARLDELIDHLGINFPVWIVVTKVDLVGGFVEFFGQSDPATRRQMMGWTLPPSEGGRFRVQDFEQRYDLMVRKLREIRPAMVAGAKLRDRAAAFGFPDEMASLSQPLARMLQRMFAPNVYQETPLLRGVYITSATQQGTPLQKAAARVREMLGAPPVDADAEASAVKHAYFVTDLMHERILPDQAMTWTTQTEVQRGRQKRIGINMIGASAGVLLAFLALAVARWGARDLTTKVETVAGAERDASKSAVERVEAIRGVYEDFPEAPGFLGMLRGEGSTREAVRRREIERYRLSVLDEIEKRARTAIDAVPAGAPPDAAQVMSALSAWEEFEDAAAVVRSVAAEAKDARKRSGVERPVPQDILAFPAVPATDAAAPPRVTVPPDEAKKAPYAQDAADLVRALKFRWRDDKPRVDLLERAAKLKGMTGAKVPPTDDFQPSGRLALAVWRNHEWVQGADDWGAKLRESAKDVLRRWDEEQARRVQSVADFNERVKQTLGVGLAELRTRVESVAVLSEGPIELMEDLRSSLDAVVVTCGDPRFNPPTQAETSLTPPDWAGGKALQAQLAEIQKRDPKLAEGVGAAAVRTRVEAWLKQEPVTAAAGPGTEKPTTTGLEKVRAAARGLGDDVKGWLAALPKGAPVTVRRTAAMPTAAREMEKVAQERAVEFDSKVAPRLQDLGWAKDGPKVQLAAKRLVYAVQVDGFLTDATGVSYKLLADRLKLEGEAPRGAAELGRGLAELLAVLPREEQGSLPADVEQRVLEAAKAAFAVHVSGVENEWATEVAKIEPLQNLAESRPFLRQFSQAGGSARVRPTAQMFEQKWAGGPPKEAAARKIWQETVLFPDKYLVLRTARLNTLWERLERYANASPVLADADFDGLVSVAQSRYGRKLELDPSSPAEQALLDGVRRAYATAEEDVFKSIADFLNGRWNAVRQVALRGRKGEKLTEADQRTRSEFRQRLTVAFPGRTTMCGPLRMKPGVWESLETTAEDAAVADRDKPLHVTVQMIGIDFKDVAFPYLRVRYVEDGSPAADSAAWSPSDANKPPFVFTWIPRKARRFELLRANDAGAEKSLLTKTGEGCVIDLLDAASGVGQAGEYRFEVDKNVVRLRVTFDDPARADNMRTARPVAPGTEIPEFCIEPLKTGR